MIRCPKCGLGFPILEENSHAPAARVATNRPPKSSPAVEREDRSDGEPRRPGIRKRKKKKFKKAARNNSAGLLIGIGAAVLLVGAGITLAVVFWPSDKTPETVASNTPSSGPPERGMSSTPAPGSETGDGPAPEPLKPRSRPQPPAPANEPGAPQQQGTGSGRRSFGSTNRGESQLLAAGRSVFEANNCARCHALGGDGGGNAGASPMGRGRGPDLSQVGADPEHTVEWLMEHVRDPRSHNPQSRMPAFGGRIQAQDLRSLAVYLASLK
jgi:mono/diheme cytochrome c family protein